MVEKFNTLAIIFTLYFSVGINLYIFDYSYNAESGDQLGIRAAAVDISLFRFTKIFLSADDVPHEARTQKSPAGVKRSGTPVR
jgi:hypothetical protein